MESEPKAAPIEGAKTNVDHPKETDVTDELARLIASLQEAAKETRKASPAYNLATLKKALTAIRVSLGVAESLKTIEDSLQTKIQSTENEFDVEIHKVASDLGLILEGRYPLYMVRQLEGRATSFEVLEPHLSYSIDGRTVRKTDLSEALLALPTQSRTRPVILDDATFKKVVDMAYDLATAISKDDTVMIKRVVDVASSACKSLGVDADCRQLISKLYFDGGLDMYELFQSGGKDTTFTFQHGDSQAKRTLMRRKSQGTRVEGV